MLADDTEVIENEKIKDELIKIYDCSDLKKFISIIRIIYHKDCSGLPILPNKKLCEQYKQASEDNIFQIVQGLFCKHVELIRKGLSNDGFAFVALEKCDITLLFFLKKYLNNSLEGVVIFKSI